MTVNHLGDDMKPIADERCSEFHASWVRGDRPRIEDYLPAPDDPQRRGTLLELIRIDMQMRAQSTIVPSGSESGAAPADAPMSVDQYISRFEELRTDDVLKQLRDEFELIQDTDRDPLSTHVGDDSVPPMRLSHTHPDAARYQVVGQHARGGMGVIWRVIDKKLGREVALKKLPTSLSTRAGTRSRFVSEAKITAQLEHPGIVPIYDLTDLETDDASYTMKLLRGETLTTAIARFHQMDVSDPGRTVQRARLIEVFLSICRAIAYAHARQVIHRDLKPDNVLLGEFGETAVLDWGLAKSLGRDEPDQTVSTSAPTSRASNNSRDADSDGADPVVVNEHDTRQGAILGTPAYMAPEQALGQSLCTSCDIYSLGAVLYQILCGQPPFRGGSVIEVLDHVVNQQPPSPRTIVPDTPRVLAAICMRAMAKQQADRFESVAALVEDLEHYLADEPIVCYRESRLERIDRWMRKHRQQVVVAIAGILLVAVSMTAYVLVDRANQASQFAEQQRIQQARSAAGTADAVATQRLRSGDFASSVEILDRAVRQLPNQPELDPLRESLEEKRTRAHKLATFYDLRRELVHQSVTQESELAFRTASRCLDSLGIAEDITNNRGKWWLDLPTDDLLVQQRDDLREDVYAVFLQLAAIHANGGISEFVAINSTANYFNVSTNDLIKSKMQKATIYLDRAEAYRPTTTATYLRSIFKLTVGDISFLEWISEWLTLAPLEPESAVDCFYTSGIYLMAEDVNKQMPLLMAAAKLLGSESKLPDSQQEAERLLFKAIRLRPDYYSALYQAGMQLSKRGNFLAAEQSFTTCIRIDPESAEAYTGRAMALMVHSMVVEDETWAEKLKQQSLDDITTAMKIAPSNALLRQEAGILRFLLGDFERGFEDLLIGLDNSSLRITRQTLSRQAERVTLQNNIDIQGDQGADPGFAAIYKATIAMNYFQPREAMGFVQEVPPNHSDYYRVLAIKAQAAHDLGKGTDDWTKIEPDLTPEKALTWANESLKLNPKYYRALRARLLLLLRLDRYDEVVTSVENSDLDTEDYVDWQKFELLWIKSQALSALGRQEAAEATVEAAKSISMVCFECVSRDSD